MFFSSKLSYCTFLPHAKLLTAFSEAIQEFMASCCSTSFPGSVIRGKKDPGSGWSRASQKVGGDKKKTGREA